MVKNQKRYFTKEYIQMYHFCNKYKNITKYFNITNN